MINAISQSKMHVQHVFSKSITSSIFDDLYNYFDKYCAYDWSLERSIRPTKADVYHYYRPQLESELLTPGIVTVHHDLEEIDKFVAFDKFEPRYNECARIICLNHTQQKFLSQLGYKNTVVIPHGYNERVIPEPKKRTIRNSNRKFTLGIASRRYARRVKGEALLYEIGKRLPVDEFSFILVGAGRSVEAAMLRGLGFETTVFEYMPYSMMNQFYQSIDALLVLSWHEGGPACVPEAIASATPIFGTPVGMVTDYLTHLENGIVLGRNPNLDAQIIVDTARNRYEMLEKMNLSAYERKDKAWRWSAVIKSHFDLYRAVVDG